MTSSLYEQVGGAEAIKQLIPSFYTKVLGDPDLAPFFENVSITRLHNMQSEFFSLALGGPVNYSDFDLYAIHNRFNIKRHHLTRFTEHLMETLQQIGLDESVSSEVVARIATYADEILGESGIDG